MVSSPANVYMKAKKDDYWNKISKFNSKLHDMEQAQEKQNKKNSQMRMRQFLAD